MISIDASRNLYHLSMHRYVLATMVVGSSWWLQGEALSQEGASEAVAQIIEQWEPEFSLCIGKQAFCLVVVEELSPNPTEAYPNGGRIRLGIEHVYRGPAELTGRCFDVYSPDLSSKEVGAKAMASLRWRPFDKQFVISGPGSFGGAWCWSTVPLMPAWENSDAEDYTEVLRFFEAVECAQCQPDIDKHLRSLVEEERYRPHAIWAAKVLVARSAGEAAPFFKQTIAADRISLTFACHLNRLLLALDNEWRLSDARYALFHRAASEVKRDLPMSVSTVRRHHYAIKLHNRLASLRFWNHLDYREGHSFVREGALNIGLGSTTRHALFDLACLNVGRYESDISPCERLDMILRILEDEESPSELYVAAADKLISPVCRKGRLTSRMHWELDYEKCSRVPILLRVARANLARFNPDDPRYLASMHIYSYGLLALLKQEARLVDDWRKVYSEALAHPCSRVALAAASNLETVEWAARFVEGISHTQFSDFRLTNKYRMNKAARAHFSAKDDAFRDHRPVWLQAFFVLALAAPIIVFLCYETRLLQSRKQEHT